MDNPSKHFSYNELIKSNTALRFGIKNTPNAEQIMNAKCVAEGVLEPCRKHFGKSFSPTSWLRVEELEKKITWDQQKGTGAFVNWCKRHNRGISDPESWKAYFALKSHPRGEAVDFEISGVSNYELACFIRDNLEFDQVILEFYNPDLGPHSGWVHASKRAYGGNRMQELTIFSGGRPTALGLIER